MTTKIDSDKLLNQISLSPFGTGTLSEEAGIHVDQLHGLLAHGEGDHELVEKLHQVLPGDWVEESVGEEAKTKEVKDVEVTTPPPQPTTTLEPNMVKTMTVREAKKAVKDGELDPEEAYQVEQDREKEEKRKTLLQWLEDRIES